MPEERGRVSSSAALQQRSYKIRPQERVLALGSDERYLMVTFRNGEIYTGGHFWKASYSIFCLLHPWVCLCFPSLDLLLALLLV